MKAAHQPGEKPRTLPGREKTNLTPAVVLAATSMTLREITRRPSLPGLDPQSDGSLAPASRLFAFFSA
jgi:hypothetical protein